MSLQPQTEQSEFKKGLGLFDSTTLVAGSMIGSGVFVVASGMLQAPDPAKGVWGVPYPALMLLVWIVAGIITLCGALTYAEFASALPKAGGPYVYLRESCGPFWGFLYGWTFFFAIQSGFMAGVSVVFGRAAFALFSHESYGTVSGELWPVRITAIVALLFLTFWNFFGVRMGAIVQNIFTVLKIGAIVFLIGLAFTKTQVASGVPAWPPVFTKDLGVGFGVAMIAALWAYDAWYMVMFAGGEVKDGKRTLPWALVLGTSIVTVVYCLANWSYVHVLPVAQLQHLHDIKGIAGIEAAKVMMGTAGALFVTIAILVSTFGCLNGIILTGSRAFYAMAKDRLFLKSAGNLHPVYKTPVVALIAQLIWSVLLIALPGQTYDKIFTYVEFSSFLFYAITVIGLFNLRAKHPGLASFKVPTVIPIVYFILVAAFLVNTVRTQPRESGYGLILIAIGALVYLFVGTGKKERVAA